MTIKDSSNRNTNGLWLKIILLASLFIPVHVFMHNLVIVTTPSIEPKILWTLSGSPNKGEFGLFEIANPLIADGSTHRLTKMVGCSPGELLHTKYPHFFCEGKLIATAKTHSPDGRELPKFIFNGPIPLGKVFMLGQHENSFDSRYLGFIDLNSTTKLGVIW